MNLADVEAQTVKCPICVAPIGQPCRSTDMRFPGQPLAAIHRGRAILARAEGRGNDD